MRLRGSSDEGLFVPYRFIHKYYGSCGLTLLGQQANLSGRILDSLPPRMTFASRPFGGSIGILEQRQMNVVEGTN